MPGKFYITTSIAYTNAPVHVGFALELLLADALARFHRLAGEDTFFLTGTDEHGAKISKASKMARKSEKEFVDEISDGFRKLTSRLNVSNDDFIRTTDRERHWPTAIKVWNQLREKGDIYKKKYKGLYCFGHESFVKKSDLVNGICPLHKTEPEELEEENYFFKLTRYASEVKKLIEKDDLLILPSNRKREILNVIDDAEDISVSRPSEALKWGIPVPNDSSQTFWVWIDALSNYISALDYAGNDKKFKKYWPADVHLIGKDILRFHALIWPAMLISLDLPLPKAIYVHGFITVEGEKISKSLGNVIDPFELIKKYGVDPVRYFLLRESPSGEDGEFSYAKLEERYNGDLANGLGNLVQRVVTLLEQGLVGEFNYRKNLEDSVALTVIKIAKEKYEAGLANFRLHDSLGAVWELIGWANGYVNEHRPWELAKSDPDHFLRVMTTLVRVLLEISYLLFPFLPSTAEKISASFGWDLRKDLSGLDHEKLVIKKGAGLFPRLN